jgi:uncharacterized protein (DUF2164 family)
MSKKKDPKIIFTKEERQDLIAVIKSYFKKQREEELGDLAAMLMLDFIIDKIGPKIYNQGVKVSIKYMGDRVDDLYSLEI